MLKQTVFPRCVDLICSECSVQKILQSTGDVHRAIVSMMMSMKSWICGPAMRHWAQQKSIGVQSQRDIGR